MHVSEKAQRDRFEARRTDPLKSWKLTDEDWRNIAKRPAYEKAVADMLKRTDHKHAPWTVVAADSKPYARVAVVEAVIEALERGLRDAGQEPIELEAML
jgi:polyphosphate kinase 2 (PPK2 family)